eukprot:gene4839-5086_t
MAFCDHWRFAAAADEHLFQLHHSGDACLVELAVSAGLELAHINTLIISKGFSAAKRPWSSAPTCISILDNFWIFTVTLPLITIATIVLGPTAYVKARGLLSSSSLSYLAQCLLPGLLLTLREGSARRAWAARQQQIRQHQQIAAPAAPPQQAGTDEEQEQQGKLCNARPPSTASNKAPRPQWGKAWIKGDNSSAVVTATALDLAGERDRAVVQQHLAAAVQLYCDQHGNAQAALAGNALRAPTELVTAVTAFPGSWHVMIHVVRARQEPSHAGGSSSSAQEQQPEQGNIPADLLRGVIAVEASPQGPDFSQQELMQLTEGVLRDWPGWTVQHVQQLSMAEAGGADDAAGGEHLPKGAGCYLQPPAVTTSSPGTCLSFSSAAVQQLQLAGASQLRVVVTQQPSCSLLLDLRWTVQPELTQPAADASEGAVQDAHVLLNMCDGSHSAALEQSGVQAEERDVLAGCQVLHVTVCLQQMQSKAGAVRPANADPPAAAAVNTDSTQAGGDLALGVKEDAAEAATADNQATHWQEVQKTGQLLAASLESCFDDLGLTECYKLLMKQQWLHSQACSQASGSSSGTHTLQQAPSQVPLSSQATDNGEAVPGRALVAQPSAAHSTGQQGGRADEGFTLGLRKRTAAAEKTNSAAEFAETAAAGGGASGSGMVPPSGGALERFAGLSPAAAAGSCSSWGFLVLGLPVSGPLLGARRAFAAYKAAVLCHQDCMVGCIFLLLGSSVLLRLLAVWLWHAVLNNYLGQQTRELQMWLVGEGLKALMMSTAAVQQILAGYQSNMLALVVFNLVPQPLLYRVSVLAEAVHCCLVLGPNLLFLPPAVSSWSRAALVTAGGCVMAGMCGVAGLLEARMLKGFATAGGPTP